VSPHFKRRLSRLALTPIYIATRAHFDARSAFDHLL
jgi:hypothetical protein